LRVAIVSVRSHSANRLAEQTLIHRRAYTGRKIELERKIVHVVERITTRQIDAMGKPQPMSTRHDQFKKMTLARAVGSNYANESCLGIQYEFEVFKVPPLGNLNSSYPQVDAPWRSVLYEDVAPPE
jgi:hypothetical protein